MDSNQIYHRLGQIDGELKAINRRLDDGSTRHRDLDDADDDLRVRVAKLELVEAKRAGVMTTVAAIGSLIGGLAAILINYLLKKI